MNVFISIHSLLNQIQFDNLESIKSEQTTTTQRKVAI